MMDYTKSPHLIVEVTKPTNEEKDSYFKGGVRPPEGSSKYPKTMNRVEILKTFDSEKYPVGSEWMIGQHWSEVNYFGDKITLIQERDLYARVK